MRTRALRHDEVFAVQRNEPDFDFPRQSAHASYCRNVDVARFRFSRFEAHHDQLRLPSDAGEPRDHGHQNSSPLDRPLVKLSIAALDLRPPFFHCEKGKGGLVSALQRFYQRLPPRPPPPPRLSRPPPPPPPNSQGLAS